MGGECVCHLARAPVYHKWTGDKTRNVEPNRLFTVVNTDLFMLSCLKTCAV